MSLPDDIIFVLFDLMTPDEALGYALSCKTVYEIWINKLIWRKKLSNDTDETRMMDIIDNSTTPYKTYTFLKTGFDLKAFYEKVSEVNQMQIFMAHETMTNYWSQKLTKLDFFDCNLTSIPAFIGNITSLKQLIFEGNFLETIPSSFKKLVKLEYLNLSYNKFQRISPTFEYLTGLKCLKMEHNSLSVIPSFIYDMTNLEELIVGHNKIRYIQNEITQLTKLRVLLLNENMLSSIPFEISKMPRLVTLHLYRNKKLRVGTTFNRFHQHIPLNDNTGIPNMRIMK